MTARWLSFYWSPERQEIACDGERFAHPLATQTSPSHDIAHLLAAAGGLPWRPLGPRDQVCFSECNAVFIEHLAVNIFDTLVLERSRTREPLERTLEHVEWFVNEHYAPFPVSFDAAMRTLSERIQVDTVVRLSPVIFRMRAFELRHPDFPTRTFGARFTSAFDPPLDWNLRELRGAFQQALLHVPARA